MGESVARVSRLVLDRGGRSKVKVRVIGWGSLGWIESAVAWGCHVEAVVVGSHNEYEDIIRLLTNKSTTTASHVNEVLPNQPRQWKGLLVGTVHNEVDATLFFQLFHQWQPSIAILSAPSRLSRHKLLAMIPKIHPGYEKKLTMVRHSQVGGVTDTSWHLMYLSRLPSYSRPPIMTEGFYERPLQTALDDTLGREARWDQLEPQQGVAGPVIGSVTIGTSDEPPKPVFSAQGLGPDISLMDCTSRYFWVASNSVMGKGSRVLRRVNLHELNAMWDYEGKREAIEWSQKQRAKVLRARIKSPPGEIIRVWLAGAAAVLADLTAGDQQHKIKLGLSKDLKAVGLTRNVEYSPSLEDKSDTRVKAALPDDAAIDLSNWSYPGETPQEAAARQVLRRFACKWWAYNLEREAMAWLHTHGNEPKDRAGIDDCLRRAKAATYFNWVRGSSLFFWRLPKEFQSDYRDGLRFFHWCDGPKGSKHNIPAPTREAELKSREKVFSLYFQWYLEKGFVRNVIPRFPVVKSEQDGVILDIRVVFDSKSNGHNETLWAPSFILPDFGDVMEHVVKWLALPVAEYLEAGSPSQDYKLPASTFIKTKQGDIDVGGMFHNFRVHESERPNLGVRWIHTDNAPGAVEKHSFFRFCVSHFGGKFSPYQACQGQTRILEWCKGDRHNLLNPWQWDRVYLNLPPAKNYDPSMPRVMKLRKDGELATQEATFVDDIHPSGRERDGEEKVSQACRTMKSRMNSVGNQAADRKYRPPTLWPGAWNGSIIHTDTPFPMKSTTKKKWDKFKSALEWIWDTAAESDMLDTTKLRKIAGLGVNLTEIYTDARPYLKGFFNAIEAFREHRDIDGWRLQTAMDAAREFSGDDQDDEDESDTPSTEYPVETKVTAELLMHVEALRTMFVSDTSLMLPLRPTDSHKLRYTIGDASAEGHGAGCQYPSLIFEGRDGLWTQEFSKNTSNLREAQNLVNYVISDIRAHKHDGCEVWIFTDNSVFSYVFQKGLSTSKELFYLVLELKILARVHEVFLRMCHISGNRMIATGMDGWSRGNYNAGLSLGYDVRDFLPLDRSAFQVGEDPLALWFKSWMGSDYTEPLEPEGWFEEGHRHGVHIWSPPPAAALIVLKELARARHKRPWTSTHVVVIPRLLYQEEWRTRFEKEVDLWFTLQHGDVWPHYTHEPLMIGIRFPLSRSYPWEVKLERERVVGIGRALSSLSSKSHILVGDYLRKLWRDPRAFPEV